MKNSNEILDKSFEVIDVVASQLLDGGATMKPGHITCDIWGRKEFQMNIINLSREEVVEAIAATKQVIGEYRGELEQTGGCAFCAFKDRYGGFCADSCPLYIATGSGCNNHPDNIPRYFIYRSASERQQYTAEFDERADYLEREVLKFFEDLLAEMDKETDK